MISRTGAGRREATLRPSALAAAITLAIAVLAPAGVGVDASASASANASSLWSSRVPVGDERLDSLRGGYDTANGLQLSFGIERAVFINGELVAVTRLVFSDLSTLLKGGAASTQALANAFTLVQNGPGNSVTTDSGSISTAAAANSQPSPITTAASTPSVTDAISTNPVTASAAPAVPVANNLLASSAVPVTAPPPSTGAATLSAAPATVPTPTTAVASSPPPVATPASSPAAAAATNPANFTNPMTVQINGQTLLLPNASSIVTAVQNTLNNQFIETRTTIDATLNSLSLLRSGAFATALRQQTLDSVRR